MNRIRSAFAIALPLTVFFEAPTLRAFAGMVEQRVIDDVEALGDDEVADLLDTSEAPGSGAQGASEYNSPSSTDETQSTDAYQPQ